MPIKTKFTNFRVYLLFSALAFTISANNTFSALFLKKFYGVILCTCKTQFCVYVSLRRLFWEFYCCLVAKSCPTLCNPTDSSCQALLSMGFPRQDYFSGLQFPSPGYLPNPGIEPTSPALAGGFFNTEPPGKPPLRLYILNSFHFSSQGSASEPLIM